MKFSEFGFDPEVMEGIDAMGFETPTPIQEQAIPAIIEGKDLIGSAQTGTGKTAAFLLPLIQRIIATKGANKTKAVIIVPTRELAQQIDQHMEGFSYFTPVSSIAVYGGGDGSLFAQEKKALSDGVELVVCTPGRMIAHLLNNYVRFEDVEYLVLDEADRMLDMGFHDDIMKIISYMPKKRQNLMFSATMPPEIRKLAKSVLHQPDEINIAISKPADKILQTAYVVYEAQKKKLVAHLLKGRDLKRVLVFCSTKISAKELGRHLRKIGLNVEDIHSDLDQKQREAIMLDFRNWKVNILVATDLLSRGIDVDNIELVINYDVPNEAEDYIHRIGRTARAESDGIAITLISEEEQFKFGRIEKLLEKEVTKTSVPEEFGDTPKYEPERRRGGGGGRYQGKGGGGGRNKGSKNYKGNKNYKGKPGNKGPRPDRGSKSSD